MTVKCLGPIHIPWSFLLLWNFPGVSSPCSSHPKLYIQLGEKALGIRDISDFSSESSCSKQVCPLQLAPRLSLSGFPCMCTKVNYYRMATSDCVRPSSDTGQRGKAIAIVSTFMGLYNLYWASHTNEKGIHKPHLILLLTSVLEGEKHQPETYMSPQLQKITNTWFEVCENIHGIFTNTELFGLLFWFLFGFLVVFVSATQF